MDDSNKHKKKKESEELRKAQSPPTPPHDPPKNMRAATHRLKAYALKQYRRKMRSYHDVTSDDNDITASASHEIQQEQKENPTHREEERLEETEIAGKQRPEKEEKWESFPSDATEEAGSSSKQEEEEEDQQPLEGDSEQESKMESQFKRKEGENDDSDNNNDDEQQTPASGGTSPTPEVTSPAAEEATSGSRIRGISESQEMFLAEIGASKPEVDDEGEKEAEPTTDNDVTKPTSPTQAVTSSTSDAAPDDSGEGTAPQVVEAAADVDETVVTSQPEVANDDVTTGDGDDVVVTASSSSAAQPVEEKVDDDVIKADGGDDVNQAVVTSESKDDDVITPATPSAAEDVIKVEAAEAEPNMKEEEAVMMTSSNEDDDAPPKEDAQKSDDVITEEKEKSDDVTAAKDEDTEEGAVAAEDGLKSAMRVDPPVVDSTPKSVTFEGDPPPQEVEAETNQQATAATTTEKTEDEGDKKKSPPKKRPPKRRTGMQDINETIDEEDLIADDFYYDSEQYQSTSRVTEDSGIPPNLLQFYHSFGYDCCKRSNLCLLAGPTLLLGAGTMIHLINLEDESAPQHTFIRSCGGGGIGAITVHPNGKYFAVAEKGKKPNILIYEFPSLKLYRILKGGTLKGFSFVDFNPKGDLLASMGCAPDYMLTVWNWKQELIMLRSKAFSQDIFKVTFAPDHEGQLVSCGTTHIRFWKMAWTFTGLKLKGDLGRFGKTGLTDIEGYLQLPSTKVLSGCNWGNMLLWDGGLIELEVRRKKGKKCHDGSIQQFFLDEGELITIGTDGCVRVWDCEAIETADTTSSDEAIFEIEPMNELRVGKGVRLDSMVKVPVPVSSVEGGEVISNWFAQDSMGGIWKLDLTFSHTTKTPKKLFTFCAGPVKMMASSPKQNLIAVVGDLFVRVHNYEDHSILCSFQSPNDMSRGTCVSWPANYGDRTGKVIVAGYADGIVRVLTLIADEETKIVKLKLLQAMKPHSGAVTRLAFDSGCKYMVSGGADNTCFFFAVQAIGGGEYSFRPIGFVTVEGVVSSLEFSPDHFPMKTVLVGLKSGKVVEIGMPDEKAIDTSSSFLIDNIHKRYFNLKSVKVALRKAEEEEIKEALRKERLEERKKLLKQILDTGKEMTDEEKEEFLANDVEEAEEEEEEESGPTEASPVLQAKYLGPGRFYLSLDNFDAGYLYECKFHETAIHPNSLPKEPIRSFSVDESKDVPITTIDFSKDRKNVLVGFKNGNIRIYPLFSYEPDEEGVVPPPPSQDKEFELSQLQKHWDMNMHDNVYGVVTTICQSFDGKRVFTSGADGNIFGYDILASQKVADSMKAASLSALIAKEGKEIVDIEDPNAYSIQDAKLKSEWDRMIALAEEKKKMERKGLEELRKRFLELLSINNELPANVRLKHEEFELDPSLREAMNKETAAKEARLRAEMQWDGAKQALAHEKLKQRYKSIVENDLVTVHSFNSSHTVSSYRIARLSERFRQLLWEVENRVNPAKSTTGGRKEHMIDGDMADAESVDSTEDLMKNSRNERSALQGRQAEMMAAAVKKADDTKRNKLLRQQQWNRLYAAKPADDYEDPADVAAIQVARTSMGDYKLKSASDYIVPFHLRIDGYKKRCQMLRLEEQIHLACVSFNRKLMNFRDRKQEIVRQMNGYRETIERLQQDLPVNERLPLPRLLVMHPDEVPSKQQEFTRDTLLTFEEEQRQQKIRDEADEEEGGGAPPPPPPPAAPSTTAGGGDKENVDDLKNRSKGEASMFSKSAKQRSKEDEAPPPRQVMRTRRPPAPTEMELQLRQLAEIETVHERDRLVRLIEDKMAEFDGELKLIRHHKTGLDVNLKMACLKRVTMLEELVLLKVYEIREGELEHAVDVKEQELDETNVKSNDTRERLDGKKKDIEKALEREKAVHAAFVSSLGRNNKFVDYLTKVFKKRIKRKKPKENGEEEEEEESSSDDDSEWSDGDDDDSTGGGNVFDDTKCPPGCNERIFQATLAIREKRLDVEEILVEDKRIAEVLRKELDVLTKKEKMMQAQLDTAVSKHEAFQVEKQMKLNELHVVVPLLLDQVEIVMNDQIPEDLTNALVFENMQHRRLHTRIKELQKEKKEQRDLYQEARQTNVRMLKNRKVVENRIQFLSDECEKLMLLKFGRIVDLDKIDSVALNRPAAEIKEKSRVLSIENEIEVSKKKKYVETLKEKMTDKIKENTKRIHRLNVLMSDKHELESKLDHRQSKVDVDVDEASDSMIQEQRRLLQLVQLQSQEIQALKDEIGILSRKGGHILPLLSLQCKNKKQFEDTNHYGAFVVTNIVQKSIVLFCCKFLF